MKITVIFDNLGPYHIARLDRLSHQCDLLAIELYSKSHEYSWKTEVRVPFRRVTLEQKFNGRLVRFKTLSSTLLLEAPDVVFIAGWSSRASLQALAWCLCHGVPSVVMADSQFIDSRRGILSEFIKKSLVSKFSGALVAGSPHKEYANKLGIKIPFIMKGYNAVDNDHFKRTADNVKKEQLKHRCKLDLPEKFFLVVARLIEKKNIIALLEAYSSYRQMVPNHRLWNLVIAGDGPLYDEIVNKISFLGISELVQMKGFLQYDETAEVISLAEALVLPSLVDQWGLVVNEAMAAGIPVLVSDRCGSVKDLVIDGKTGFQFSPEDPIAIAHLLAKFSKIIEQDRFEIGKEAQRKVQDFSLDNFSKNCLSLSGKLNKVKKRPIWGTFIKIFAMTRNRE